MVEMTTSKGVITLELDAEKAPLTVANFLEYVKSGHYDGTIFHRVIPGFVIQGGGMESGMREKATPTIKPTDWWEGEWRAAGQFRGWLGAGGRHTRSAASRA